MKKMLTDAKKLTSMTLAALMLSLPLSSAVFAKEAKPQAPAAQQKQEMKKDSKSQPKQEVKKDNKDQKKQEIRKDDKKQEVRKDNKHDDKGKGGAPHKAEPKHDSKPHKDNDSSSVGSFIAGAVVGAIVANAANSNNE